MPERASFLATAALFWHVVVGALARAGVQLADQQLAGAIMWIPAGGVYLAAALALLASWVRAAEEGTSHRGGTESRERDGVLVHEEAGPCHA